MSEREDNNETTEMENLSESKNLKKKRKNKKKRRTGARNKISSEDVDGEGNDEITRTVKLVDKMFGTSSIGPAAGATAQDPLPASSHKSLLTVQHKNLNPSIEMKRMFGKIANTEQQKKRRGAGGSNFRIKSVYLTNPKDSWPPVNRTGIYMNIVQAPDAIDAKNLLYFSFEHSQSYRAVQHKFMTSVESMDSTNIVKIINMQPYHIDALIQLSELCKLSEDNSMAGELIEHAIYAYESAFHSMFSLTSGNCRLDYRRQENRGFFIVLFKHAQFLEARACPRTALELTKFMLSLDPENDPLATILLIDFLSLRAKQFEFLIQLYEEWQHSHNLALLPNMAYSYALALYQVNRMEESDTALQYALGMFPGMLKLLLDELSVQADPRVMTHKYFGPTAFTSCTLALQQLMSLYVTRSKIVWSGDLEILAWLERNTNAVLVRVDKKDETINDYIAKRNQRYPSSVPRNILRHVILSEFKEKVPIAEFLKKETDPIVHFDPLPPLDSMNIYEKPKKNNTLESQREASNGLQLFFQSLFPSFNMRQPPADVAQAMAANAAGRQLDEAAGGADPDEDGAVGGVAIGGGGLLQAELRSSVNSIVESVRDFLSDIRVIERNPNDDGDDDSSSNGNEGNDYLT